MPNSINLDTVDDDLFVLDPSSHETRANRAKLISVVDGSVLCVWLSTPLCLGLLLHRGQILTLLTAYFRYLSAPLSQDYPL